MWRRHRLMPPYAVAAFAAMLVVAAIAGWDEWTTRFAIGAAGAALAVTATTDYRIVADTSQGLVLLRASRIRQYAVEVLEMLPSGTDIEPVGGTLLATDWQVGTSVYTVPKSSEQAISRIAER